MAIYLCEKCDEMKDADYDPPAECGDMNLVCTNCMEEIEDEKESERAGHEFERFYR